jgi:hypothetical protein
VTTILVLLVATVAFAAETNCRQNRQRQSELICSKVLNSSRKHSKEQSLTLGKKSIVLDFGDGTR